MAAAPSSLHKLMQSDPRIVGFSDDGDDGFFIYTRSAEWCDDAGSGTFRGDGVRDAIRNYKARVRKAELT